ncbi:Carboxymethylproline synthase [Cupriavidus laharis]|uniref:Carboxymethylproline synthase n=1 Tax=Cupriavidus laharis TaxID=151654 RepID=A0ABN7ZIT7_9BURK|nr:enoyl-CoA hydratase/isomerase family protein [Cupriavidus laharis]CAG9184004.1 Carboxymethylproline synthase [Cupriavidus laharis]
MNTMKQYVRVECQQAIALVTLDHPESLNAISGPMRNALIAALEELNADGAIRAIVLTGSGDRAFSSGQDLAEAASFKTEEVEGWMRHQRAMFQAVRNLDKPLVVAFNGTAAGTGFQIGLLADIRVGFADMSIGQPEVRVGLASILGSYLMTLFLSRSHNVEMSLLGRLITGERAYQLGILNVLAERGQVLSKAMEIAGEFAELPVNAVRLTKERFRVLTQPGFDEACAAVIRYHRDEYATGEPQAIMRGFLDARGRRRRESETAA